MVTCAVSICLPARLPASFGVLSCLLFCFCSGVGLPALCAVFLFLARLVFAQRQVAKEETCPLLVGPFQAEENQRKTMCHLSMIWPSTSAQIAGTKDAHHPPAALGKTVGETEDEEGGGVKVEMPVVNENESTVRLPQKGKFNPQDGNGMEESGVSSRTTPAEIVRPGACEGGPLSQRQPQRFSFWVKRAASGRGEASTKRTLCKTTDLDSPFPEFGTYKREKPQSKMTTRITTHQPSHFTPD